jgi:hypothetical protein
MNFELKWLLIVIILENKKFLLEIIELGIETGVNADHP